MIGTTFKLGFEDGAVRRGLRGIGGLMGKFGKNVGIGMAQRVGHQMTDIFGRIIMAAPQALKETMDWAGGLQDMSVKTGIAVDELVLLEEKIRLAGVNAGDVSRIMSNLGESIYDATNAAPDLNKLEAFEKLKIMAEDLDGKNAVQALDMITAAIKKGGFEVGELDAILGDIFGAKIGKEMLKFANDAEAITAQAKNNVGSLAEAMGESAGKIDQMGDALGRTQSFVRSLASIALDEFANIFGADSIDRLFDTLDPEQLRPKIRAFIEAATSFVDGTLLGAGGSISKWFDDFGKNLGNQIGEGIKESFGIGAGSKGGGIIDLFKGSPKTPTKQDDSPFEFGFDYLRNLFGGQANQTSMMSDPALKETNRLLSDLVRKDTTPRYS